MEQLRCLVCQGQSIADSDAELAGDMRDLVRRRIAAGEKPGAIRAWLVQRYGTWISYKPTAEPSAWPLWLAPLVSAARRRMADPAARPDERALMGWIVLLFLIALSVAALRLLRRSWSGTHAGAAALLLGAAGYAFQGSPELPAAPAEGFESRDFIPLAQARHAFFGDFTPAESWLRMSEALARDGESEDSVGILQNAVKRYPARSAAVDRTWQCAGRSCGHGITPPAELAYKRAEAAAPGHPAAPFFYGLALARSGDREGALKLWRENSRQGAA